MSSTTGSPLNVVTLETTLCRASAYMTSVARPEDAAIFVGITKAGKSALVNFLIGNKLVAKRIKYKIRIDKADRSHGPQIGVEVASETAIPTRYESQKLTGLSIWDCPGFDDNRGGTQDISNAFYTCELFKNIKSAKIVLVIDFATLLDDSINALRTVLRAIENLLGDKFKDHFSGIAMILTKVDTLYDIPVTSEVVADLLNNKILLPNDIDVSEAGKDLIRYLICNPQNIGFFKSATVGPVTDDISDGIIEAIDRLQAIPDHILKQISPSISESSKVSLFEAREQLSSMQIFVELQDVIGQILQDRMQHFENKTSSNLNTNELIDLSAELTVIKERLVKVLDGSISFDRKINALMMIDARIEQHIKTYRLCEKAKYIEFVDKLLSLGESHNFIICINNVLILAIQKVDELVISIRYLIGEISKEQVNEELAKLKNHYDERLEGLQEELNNLKRRNEELQRQSEIIKQSNVKRRCTIL